MIAGLVWFSQQQPVRHAVTGALTGWASAASTDYHAFRQWKSFDDLTRYDWRTALFRWMQGAISGALAGSALGQLLG